MIYYPVNTNKRNPNSGPDLLTVEDCNKYIPQTHLTFYRWRKCGLLENFRYI